MFSSPRKLLKLSNRHPEHDIVAKILINSDRCPEHFSYVCKCSWGMRLDINSSTIVDHHSCPCRLAYYYSCHLFVPVYISGPTSSLKEAIFLLKVLMITYLLISWPRYVRSWERITETSVRIANCPEPESPWQDYSHYLIFTISHTPVIELVINAWLTS